MPRKRAASATAAAGAGVDKGKNVLRNPRRSVARRSKGGRRVRSRPEQALQRHVADALRWLKPACLWFSVPNEGKRGLVAAAMLKRMGLRPGTADLIFLWETGSGCIEMKAPGEVQTDNQREFEAECRERCVPYEVCWSLDHVIDVLVRWGRLPPGTIQRVRGISFAAAKK